MRLSLILFAFLLARPFEAQTQNLIKAQQHLDQLCMPEMAGRGYVGKGDSVAAEYIRAEYEHLGLRPLSPNYYHPFKLNVNTIPNCQLQINGKHLIAGVDYAVAPSSPSINVTGPLYFIPLDLMLSKKGRKQIAKKVNVGFIPVLPDIDQKQAAQLEAYRELKECIKTNLWVVLKDQLVWSVARQQSTQAELWIRRDVLPLEDGDLLNIGLTVEAKLVKDYSSQNVGAYVEGTEFPDSFFILCGHYDHLGKMGDATYSGANDNASGIAMMLDLAAYFVQNPQPYSIAFVAFAGEEAGLVGSYHFVQQAPLICPLEQIKFVFNMDLMGNGEDGATVVNATVFPDAFAVLQSINEEKAYLPLLKKRGKAANSDHYFFSEAGVPSFFMYTMGSYTHYHIPQDNCSALSFGNYYKPCYLLIQDFILRLNRLN